MYRIALNYRCDYLSKNKMGPSQNKILYFAAAPLNIFQIETRQY